MAAKKIVCLTEKIKLIIEDIVQRHTNQTKFDKAIRQRAKIILLSSEGKNNLYICKAVSLSQDIVTKWRSRFLDNYDYFKILEDTKPEELYEEILKIFKDAPAKAVHVNSQRSKSRAF